MEKHSGKENVNWKAMFLIAGAFISYMVGSGFASGNEAFQFFGAWDMPGRIAAVVSSCIVTGLTCVCLYYLGQKTNFEKTSDIYRYLGGKYFTWFFVSFVFVDVFCSFMIMFTGAGSLGKQILGLPQWVGAIVLGIVTGIVVFGGLKTVEKVLGACGIFIQLYLIAFGLLTLFWPTSSISQADGVLEAVAAGQAYQANLLALPPFGWVPGLAEFNNGLLEGIMYSGVLIVNGIPFIMTLGKRTHNKKELAVSSVLTTIGMYLCVIFALVIMLCNFKGLIDPEAGKMYPFPILSGIKAMWPAASGTCSLIIFTGIFSTSIGLMWVLCNWILPGEERTTRSNLLICLLLGVGICLGGVLPFAAITNFMFPIFGLSGVIMSTVILVKTLQFAAKEREKKKIN